MAPHFGFPGKKKKKVEGEFSWFETTVNGGAVILTILVNASNFAPVPYLRNAAATTLSLIQIAQVGGLFLFRVPYITSVLTLASEHEG